MNTTIDELLTVGQAARRVGVDPSTIRRWTRSGRLRAIRTPGGDRRIPAGELAAATAVDTVDLAAVAPPEHLVPHWAEITAGWGGWRPPEHLSGDALTRLRMAAEMVRSDMNAILAAVEHADR